LRIVQYHPRAGSGDGGITNSVRRLSEAFARCGASSVILADADSDAPTLEGVEWRMIRHRRAGRLMWPTGLTEAIRDADLVVLNSAWTLQNVLTGRAAHHLGIPYVLAPRGAYDPLILRRRRLFKRIWWRLAEGRLVRDALAVHAFFESQGPDLARLGYTGPVLVAPNGVAVPVGTWPPASEPYLLYLGRFDPEHKGLDLLVRAVSAAPEGRLPVLRMHGPDRANGKARVLKLIHDLGAESRVVVGGAVYGDAKWQLMAGASGFVYPSRWEGFGNAPAEACALGVATVATPYPLGRFLAEHDAAILAEPTVDALLAALLRLQTAEAGAIGERAAALVRATFSWDAVAESWLAQAERLLGRRSA